MGVPHRHLDGRVPEKLGERSDEACGNERMLDRVRLGYDSNGAILVPQNAPHSLAVWNHRLWSGSAMRRPVDEAGLGSVDVGARP